MKILLVEDNTEVAESMLRAFDLRGYQAVWAPSLAQARIELGRVPLDLNLPDGLGTDLLPLPWNACVYSGLPDDAKDAGVPVFSKGDPFALLDHIESISQSAEKASRGEE